jgi:hypothetical protein
MQSALMGSPPIGENAKYHDVSYGGRHAPATDRGTDFSNLDDCSNDYANTE